MQIRMCHSMQPIEVSCKGMLVNKLVLWVLVVVGSWLIEEMRNLEEDSKEHICIRRVPLDRDVGPSYPYFSDDPASEGENSIVEAIEKPVEPAIKGPSWRDLFEPGVKHVLFFGVGLQILQQFSGINGVLYYTSNS